MPTDVPAPTPGTRATEGVAGDPPGDGLADLSRLGLDADMLRLYRAALRGGDTSPPALAVASGLSRERAERGLDRLADAGFLTAFGAVAPRSALRGAVVQRGADLAAQQAELRALDARVEGLADALWPQDARLPVRDAELVVGASAIARLTTHLVMTAQHEVLVLDAPPYVQLDPQTFAPPSAHFQVGADTDVAQALAAGVSFRRIVAQEGLAVPGRMSGIRDLAGAGMAVRVRPTLPTKLVLVDGTTALLPPTAATDPAGTGLVLRGSLLAHVLVPLFESLWADAVPLADPGAEARTPEDVPTPEERELLALLTAGLKDEAIARQLDVHVATARRRITALLTRLGATTRFQAGIQAARRGWTGDDVRRPPCG